MRLSKIALVAGACWLCASCGGSPPPPPDAIKPVAEVAEGPGAGSPGLGRPSAGRPDAEGLGAALPIDPAQLAQLKQALGELSALVDQGQSTKARFEGASSQGRSRMIQRQLRTSLDSLDRPVPFRENLERVVAILSQSQGDELSEGDREAILKEIKAVRDELGLSDSAGDDRPAGLAPGPPGPKGPSGPGPGGPPGPPGR